VFNDVKHLPAKYIHCKVRVNKWPFIVCIIFFDKTWQYYIVLTIPEISSWVFKVQRCSSDFSDAIFNN